MKQIKIGTFIITKADLEKIGIKNPTKITSAMGVHDKEEDRKCYQQGRCIPFDAIKVTVETIKEI